MIHRARACTKTKPGRAINTWQETSQALLCLDSAAIFAQKVCKGNNQFAAYLPIYVFWWGVQMLQKNPLYCDCTTAHMISIYWSSIFECVSCKTGFLTAAVTSMAGTCLWGFIVQWNNWTHTSYSTSYNNAVVYTKHCSIRYWTFKKRENRVEK